MKRFYILLFSLSISMSVWAQNDGFCIADNGATATIVVDGDDWKGVIQLRVTWGMMSVRLQVSPLRLCLSVKSCRRGVSWWVLLVRAV